MLCEKEHINLTEKIKYELKGIVENKTEIMLHVLKNAVIIHVASIYIYIYIYIYIHTHTYTYIHTHK